MSIALLFIFLILMIIGVPVAVALGIASLITLVVFTDIPVNLIIQSMFSSMNSFVMVAVPLFLLAGILMDEGGVSERIFKFANSLVGWMPGGLGNVTILSGIIFGTMSGSAIAGVTGVGKICINSMTRYNYPLSYATAISTASSILATIIPPSILMVVAAAVANVSVGGALMAGLIPGVILGIILMIYNTYVCKKYKIGIQVPFSFNNFVSSFISAFPALLVPVIIIGGILSGLVTPTEAAGIAAVYAIIVAVFVYREIKVEKLPDIFYRTAKMTGTILFIAVTAKPASWIFEYDGLTVRLASLLGSITHNPIITMLILYAFFIIVGMFMDATAAIYILVPVLLPAIKAANINPLYFIVLLVISLSYGLITPPVGVCLYAASNTTGLKLDDIIRSIMPWLILIGVSLIIFILFPALVTTPLKWFGF